MAFHEQNTKYFIQMNEIHNLIIIYFDKMGENESEFQTFISYIQDHKIDSDKQKFKSILYLISKFSMHHHRSKDFFEKIDKILIFYKSTINQNFSNNDIFHIFKSNKRVLLSLFEHGIMTPDSSIAYLISHCKFEKRKYHEYFYPEFKEFLSIKNELYESNPEEFLKLRKIGENEDHVCQLIRNDSLEEFISYTEKNKVSLTTHLKTSIFETNNYLLKRQPSLIQYSAFFGSFHIFNYLLKKINDEFIEDDFDNAYCYDDNYDEYHDNLMWLYSIHGCNLLIMQKLKKNEYKTKNNSYFECFIESIKCHHFEISKSLQKNIKNDFTSVCLKYYNFCFLPNNFIAILDDYFFDFCKNDYSLIVDNFIKTKKVSLNEAKIFNLFSLILFQNSIF